ncbi:MAG: CopG family transcriptional regulator [Candidatus Moranbacteria bacterium]|nr:CopG family transcriptional regulator [Candidatus Moranbacteria bacterium]
MEKEKNLYTVSIMILDRKKAAAEVNQTLTKKGHLFLGRMGIPLSRHCKKGCMAMINLTAECSQEELEELIDILKAIEKTEVKYLKF